MHLNWTEFWNKSYWLDFKILIFVTNYEYEAVKFHKFRLPRRDTWDDVPTKMDQLWNAVYLAIPILMFRVFVEVTIGLQLGKWLGYIEEPLEIARRNHLFGGFALQTKRKKVLETFWRFFSYLLLFTLGCFVLKDKAWIYNNHECYIGYPRRAIEPDVW